MAETGVERERQCGEQRVLRAVLQIFSDAFRPAHHIAVRKNDAFGLAGAARGIERIAAMSLSISRAAAASSSVRSPLKRVQSYTCAERGRWRNGFVVGSVDENDMP